MHIFVLVNAWKGDIDCIEPTACARVRVRVGERGTYCMCNLPNAYIWGVVDRQAYLNDKRQERKARRNASKGEEDESALSLSLLFQ